MNNVRLGMVLEVGQCLPSSLIEVLDYYVDTKYLAAG